MPLAKGAAAAANWSALDRDDLEPEMSAHNGTCSGPVDR